MVFEGQTSYQYNDWDKNGIVPKLVANTVSVDGLAPSGARSSADTVMTMLNSYMRNGVWRSNLLWI